MSDAKNGGQAFPSKKRVWRAGYATNDYEPVDGMTLRDYFIAHAPADPQPWFHPTIDDARPKTRWVGEDGKEYANIREAERECGDCFSNANEAAQDAWDAEVEKRRYIQWPAAWADAILKERK